MKLREAIERPIEDPRTRLEVLLQTSALIAGYFYIYIYQDMLHISVQLLSLRSLYQMPIVALVIIPLLRHILVKPDPLQRSPSQMKAIRFFQKELPSKYLLERCTRCIETPESCRNYINKDSFDHVRYWFNIFHGPMEKENSGVEKETYWKGYRCKLLYGLSWILPTFFILALLTILVHHLYLYIIGKSEFDFQPLYVYYPLICGSIWILIKVSNKVDDNKPSGCWQAWRQINRIHIGWLRSNEDVLVSFICVTNGNDKQFTEKVSGTID